MQAGAVTTGLAFQTPRQLAARLAPRQHAFAAPGCAHGFATATADAIAGAADCGGQCEVWEASYVAS
eukprot:365726-Chlamydomonas_euryale.AAC.3